MPRLAVVRDEKFQEHLTPESHPESPQRLVAIDQALHKSHLIREITRLEPRPATEDELTAVHKLHYVEELKEKSDRLQNSARIEPLDPDTYMSPETYDTAKLAAGAGLVAVDAVGRPDTESSFVVVRPPGHHAFADRPMGFCLFNNIALAVRHAQQKLGFERIFVVDWDVHHGNGTEDLFYDDPSVFFLSLHQYPFWPPDSGWYTQDGRGEGRGYNLNIPLPAGTGDRGYEKAWRQIVEPVCHEYGPDLIMLSAGYDAHQDDPLGQQRISTGGYARLSKRLRHLSEAEGVKVVGFLEGGYNTKSLADAVVATMQVLNADGDTADGAGGAGSQDKDASPTLDRSPDLVDARIADVRDYFSSYWKALR